MKSGLVTIKDIALKAKVSMGTVDRVLHNRGKVAEKVRARIQKIIDESNYEPNLMARALGSKKRYNFAALIPDPKIDAYWQAPKTGIEKAERELKQYGVEVTQFIFNPYDRYSFIRKAEDLTATAPDGILFSPIFYRETLPFVEKWRSAKIPFVLFNTEILEFEPLSYIGQDSYQSGKLVGKLMHYGHSEPCSILIAHIDEETGNAAHLVKKEKGLRDYFDRNDELRRYDIIRLELDRSDPVKFNTRLLTVLNATEDLKYIFVTSSKAHYIASFLEDRAMTNIRIIGYDLMPENLEYLDKGTISFLINQNPRGQGYWGINQLADFLIFKKEVSKLKFLPLDIVTKENLSYYVDQQELAHAELMA